jgi:ATP adenylyltransferase
LLSINTHSSNANTSPETLHPPLDFFGLTQAELNAINSLTHSQKKVIEGLDKTVEGFNIGANCGEIAGQSVWHCHIHLIPRRRGDVERPKGGVRNVIPNKGYYDGGA